MPIIQAFADGKDVQCKQKRDHGRDWMTITDPGFTVWPTSEWRVKPEPREPRKFWVNVSRNGDVLYTPQNDKDRFDRYMEAELIRVTEDLDDASGD